MRQSPARRVALTGLLFALALVFSLLESWVTPMMGLPPGVKLGLANIVVLYALLFLPRWQALALVLLKALFSLLVRGAFAGLLSLAGGLLSFLVMLVLLWPRVKASVFLVSVAGAIAHNLGQLLVVRLWLGPFSLYYLPVLLISGLVMGALTALTLRALLPALRRAGFAGSYYGKRGKKP